VKLVLHQRIQPGGGLVEYEQLGPVHEREHDPELLAVALRELVDAPVEADLEALHELLAPRRLDAAARVREPVEQPPAGDPRVQLQLPGEIPAARVDRDAVAPAVKPEHPRAARARMLQVEQHSDRGRLARPVGLGEPEHDPGLDAMIEVIDGHCRPEALRQPLGVDRRAHTVSSPHAERTSTPLPATGDPDRPSGRSDWPDGGASGDHGRLLECWW